MEEKMQIKSKPTQIIKINREYSFSSKELKSILELEGNINDMGLLVGRSHNDILEGVSKDKDKWFIKTEEIKDKLPKDNRK